MKCKLFPILLMVALTGFSVCICRILKAQEVSPDEKHSISIGAEGGWMLNQQSGSFNSNCGCEPFENGKGNSGIAAFSVELELNRYISFGAKFSLDIKSTSSSYDSKDSGTVVYNNGSQFGTAYFDIIYRDNLRSTYLFIARI